MKMKDMWIITAIVVFSSFFATAYVRHATGSDRRVAYRRSSQYPKINDNLWIRSSFDMDRNELFRKDHFITCASTIDDQLDSIGDDDPFLDSLNEIQRDIVTSDLSNIRVQAGPGSGKTR